MYDVTKYLEDHPGGKEIMMEYAGMNRTIVENFHLDYRMFI